jgi:hypothetical protein
MPSSALSLAYYFVAYAGLIVALLILLADPALPGGSFYHPRFVALVHLLTLAWLTGSILGSLYIVGPLVLRVPMKVAKADWIAFGSFALGTCGMVSHFWINTYDGMAGSAAMVVGSVAWVGVRIVRGLDTGKIPWAVGLHVALAFVNFVAAASIGIVLGLDRSRGFLAVSPLAVMFAHAHLAAVGWVTMLVIGLSYRMIPMLLPAEMPSGRSVATSALLLQAGLVVLAAHLVLGEDDLWSGALMIVAGLMSFVIHVGRMHARRVPRPPSLPRRDWSAWQMRASLMWLLVAVAVGLVLSVGAPADRRLSLMWIYGVAGLVGFLAQMVAAMQGRLVPLYAWYRVYAAAGEPPAVAAHTLPSEAFARMIFVCWTIAVPVLAYGLSTEDHLAIRASAGVLLAGAGVGGVYVARMCRRAGG